MRPPTRTRVTAFARALLVLAAGAGVVLLTGMPAQAHPLGNFTRNVYAGLTITPDRIRIDHVIDLAEIPTFQERQQIDANHDGTPDPAEIAAYRDRSCARAASQVRLTSSGGGRLPLLVDRAVLSFPPGAGGLPTLRLECALSTDAGTMTTVTLADDNDAGRLGWHEVTAAGQGVELTGSDVPARSVSGRLTSYPTDLLASPLTRRAATVRWTRAANQSAAASTSRDLGTPATTPGATFGAVDTATRAFTALIGRQQLTLPFALLALLLAIGLGGLHALAPGHGKTMMAGYLIGAGGRIRDAVTIGLSVTVTHTAGVVLLGVLLTATARFAPEDIYPWTTIASGLLAVTIGITLLRTATRRYRHQRTAGTSPESTPSPALVAAGGAALQPGEPIEHTHEHPPHGHPHDHGHPHGHDAHQDQHPHAHPHPHPHDDVHRVGLKGLISLGFAGGLIPSPSALLVLLAGFSLHRAWFALLLVTAYGLGMALALAGIGLLLVRAGALVERWSRDRPSAGRLIPALALVPLAAAAVVVLGGSFLIVKGITTV